MNLVAAHIPKDSKIPRSQLVTKTTENIFKPSKPKNKLTIVLMM